MGETNQGGAGASGRRPDRPAPTAPGSAVLTPPTGLPAVGAPAPSIPAQRTSPEPISPPATVPPGTSVRMCTCGHPEEMHEHYRSGDDCGACGPRRCGSFRDVADDVGPVRRMFRRLGG